MRCWLWRTDELAQIRTRWMGGLTVSLSLGLGGAALAQAPQVPEASPLEFLTVTGTLETRKSGPAENVSGIACAAPRPDGRRTCLIVDDEAGFAQQVALEGNVLRAGPRVPILTTPDDRTGFGSPPTDLRCPETSNAFRELDGEGISFAPTGNNGDGFFYVTGSHGCSRKDGEARLAQFLLARVPYSAATDTVGTVQRTWRLSEGLRSAQRLGARFGQALDNQHGAGGLDIEGIAVQRDRLMVGFRAPVLNGVAYILPVPLEPLFSSSGTITPDPEIELSLGAETGVRDLASLPDGRILVLAGPAPDRANVGYALHLLRHAEGRYQMTPVVRLPPTGDPNVKYEGLTVLSWEAGRASVLLLHDGRPNGGPARLSFAPLD